MLADLEYNVRGPFVDFSITADQGAIIMEYPVDVAWPADALNEALKILYNYSMEIPSIYNVWFKGRVVGQLVMARDDYLSHDDRLEVFLELLRAQGLISTDGYGRMDFLADAPFVVSGMWLGQMVAAVAYKSPFGIDFPASLVSKAVQKLMNQDGWSPVAAIMIYEVFEDDDKTKLLGLWLAGTTNNLNEMPKLDETMLGEVHRCNTSETRNQFPAFAPERHEV